jgi:hypothetical protein
MNSLKDARRRIERDPQALSSRALASMVLALQLETSFDVGSLYDLDYETFELAMSILQEWRLDRYYARKLKLFDISLQCSGDRGDSG